jgi:hypothetical protein
MTVVLTCSHVTWAWQRGPQMVYGPYNVALAAIGGDGGGGGDVDCARCRVPAAKWPEAAEGAAAAPTSSAEYGEP